MKAILKALKAVYDFFAGDVIILVSVAVAFALGAILAHLAGAPNTAVVIVFVGAIAAGLVATLARELRGRH